MENDCGLKWLIIKNTDLKRPYSHLISVLSNFNTR
jgi:hypothetical protein